MFTTNNSTENFSLDGPISPWMAVVFGIGLLGVFTWSLSRERQLLGRGQTLAFWVLRATALGVAIWMLLAPTKTLVEVSTTRKSVALIVDVSESMQTVDPAGSSDDVRWMLRQSDSAPSSITRAADSAMVAAVIAERHLEAASSALAQHQRESLVVDATTAAHEALDHVRTHTTVLVDGLGSRGSLSVDAETTTLSRRVAKDLVSAEFIAFDELCEALQKGKTPADRGWRESLSDLQIRVSGIRRRLHELAKTSEAAESEFLAKSQPQSLTQLQRLPRLGRVAELLNGLERSVLSQIAEQADVRVSTFDQTSRALTLGPSPVTQPTAVPAPPPSGPLRIQQGLQSFLTSSTEEAEDAEASSSVATAGATNLSAVLEQLDRDRREQPVAAAILLTDASHNLSGAVNPRVAAAALQGTPVYVVPIGNTQFVRDVLIQSVFAPTVAMRNDDIVVEAVVQAHDCEGETCIVQLLQDDQVLDTRTISIDSGYVTRRVRFDRKLSEVGLQRFTVVTMPLDRELSALNNRSDFEVNVTRSEIKILLADEMPRWEFRYLAQLFRRDPKIDLDEMLFHPRLIATGRRQESKTFPTTADAWDQYDVVILGDLAVEHLSLESQESLIRYLRERGGTAIVIAGKESMPQAFADLPLAGVLPVTRLDDNATSSEESGYAFYVTEAGRNHSALRIADTEEATQTAWNFVNQFAPLHELSPWRLPRPSATTLISAVPKGTLDEAQSAAKSSFLCWQPVGQGRIVYFSGPETFRLRFLRGDLLHYRFWGQLLRWALASELAAGSELVRIRSDKSQYVGQEPVQVIVRLADGAGNPVETSTELKVIARSGQLEHSAVLDADEQIPGQYVGIFRSLPPGEYELEPVGDAITQAMQGATSTPPLSSLTVRPELPMELLDTRSDRGLAQQIADITGGQVVPPTAVEEVLRLTNLKPVVTQRLESRPLWVEWKYLWIIFGCLQAEWIARKVRGLS